MKTDQKYGKSDLMEFEGIIKKKLGKAKEELLFIKETLSKKGDETENEEYSSLIEGNSQSMEKENLSQLATRQHKFISQLEKSLGRIKGGSYGVCADTGNLIDKDRLRMVPHTTHSLEAKLRQRSRED